MSTLTKFFFLFFFCFMADASELVGGGYHKSLKSKILAESRDYYIYLPPSYNKSNNKYPVVYVLDGDVHRWRAISGVVEGLSTETLENQIQEAIVVAIPNTNRDRDLTPTNLPEWIFEGKVLQKFDSSGGAASFLNFIQSELIPKINSEYRTAHKRILVGESFGGLFAAYTLITKPELFTDYLIIDPTALWDNNFLNRKFQNEKINKKPPTAQVYFAFANNDRLGSIGITNKKWGQEFVSNLQSEETSKFKVVQNYFEQETHGTVAFLGWYHGLKMLLSVTAH